jgi:chemotaxis protein histidine kinase CheA
METLDLVPDLELRQWESAAQPTAATATEETTQEPTEGSAQSSDLEERLKALEAKLQEADWALRINAIAKENPQLAADLLERAADLYRKHTAAGQPPTSETPQPNVAEWFAQLEQMVSNPPVDPEWMSEEAKWMYQVAKTIVDGLKASYQASQQFWQQWMQQQQEAEVSAAEEAALARVEEELNQLKSRLGAAWTPQVEEKVLQLMEQVAEQEDRLIFPLEAYGILVARGEVAARPTLTRPEALTTFRSAPGAPMRPSRRVESVEDAIREIFAEKGIPL